MTAGPATVIDLEQELMLRFKAGDDQAFEALYRRIRGPVFRFALRMLGEEPAAEELAQEILLRVYRARTRYQPQARFRTWLFRIATNACLNERRRAWRRHEVGTRLGTAGLDHRALPASDPAARYDQAQMARAIQRALAALPPRQRAAVVLARWEGCSMRDIAHSLDTTAGAAKLLLHRARTNLERALAPLLQPVAAEAP